MSNQIVNTYTIKEVSKILNVTPSMLRQWEKDLDGLLVIPRSKQGARYYSNDEIKLLETVKQMRNENLSKEKIRELLKNDFQLKTEACPTVIETEISLVNHEDRLHLDDKSQEIALLFNTMETFKNQLIDDVNKEIRSGIRKEVLEDVKKEISKGSMQIVKSLSDSIYKSHERTKAEIEELSGQIHKTSEQTSDSIVTLSRRVAKASKGTNEQIRSLTNRVADSSEAAAEEFKTMIHYISSSAEVTHTEISALIETLNEDREIYIETINREREQYWEDVNRRELMFQDLIVNFRHAAASEEKKRPWWKIWG